MGNWTPIIWLSYPESAPFSFPGEKAEVAMAVLPLLLQGKSGMCKHTDFVEFISVSIISFIRTFKSGYDFSLKQMFASAVSKFRKGRNKDFMRCKFVHMLLILCMRNYILLVCRILLTTFYITISTQLARHVLSKTLHPINVLKKFPVPTDCGLETPD